MDKALHQRQLSFIRQSLHTNVNQVLLGRALYRRQSILIKAHVLVNKVAIATNTNNINQAATAISIVSANEMAISNTVARKANTNVLASKANINYVMANKTRRTDANMTAIAHNNAATRKADINIPASKVAIASHSYINVATTTDINITVIAYVNAASKKADANIPASKITTTSKRSDVNIMAIAHAKRNYEICQNTY